MGRGPDGGPVVPVKIVPADFHAAAQGFVDAQNALEQIRQGLLSGLGAAKGAAGGCDGAHQFEGSWAPAMDCIVNEGFHTAFDLLGSIGEGIDVSALNHATADQDSVPGKPAAPPPWTPAQPNSWPGKRDFVHLDGDPPFWMPDFLEKSIPTADTDRIDDAAQLCRRTAGAIRELVANLHNGLRGLTGNNSSDDIAELEQFWQRAAGEKSVLTGLPKAIDDVASALTGFRDWNDDTQQKIRDKIKEVVDGLGVAGVLLAIGSIITDGGLDALILGLIEALELFGVDVGGAIAAPVAEVATIAGEVLIATGGAIAITKGVVPAMQAAMSSTPKPNIESADATKISGDLADEAEKDRRSHARAVPAGAAGPDG